MFLRPDTVMGIFFVLIVAHKSVMAYRILVQKETRIDSSDMIFITNSMKVCQLFRKMLRATDEHTGMGMMLT
jgi:hypothetical protein